MDKVSERRDNEQTCRRNMLDRVQGGFVVSVLLTEDEACSTNDDVLKCQPKTADTSKRTMGFPDAKLPAPPPRNYAVNPLLRG